MSMRVIAMLDIAIIEAWLLVEERVLRSCLDFDGGKERWTTTRLREQALAAWMIFKKRTNIQKSSRLNMRDTVHDQTISLK